jgi:hypothetical protein
MAVLWWIVISRGRVYRREQETHKSRLTGWGMSYAWGHGLRLITFSDWLSCVPSHPSVLDCERFGPSAGGCRGAQKCPG